MYTAPGNEAVDRISSKSLTPGHQQPNITQTYPHIPLTGDFNQIQQSDTSYIVWYQRWRVLTDSITTNHRQIQTQLLNLHKIRIKIIQCILDLGQQKPHYRN